jgi:hypothetical protein
MGGKINSSDLKNIFSSFLFHVMGRWALFGKKKSRAIHMLLHWFVRAPLLLLQLWQLGSPVDRNRFNYSTPFVKCSWSALSNLKCFKIKSSNFISFNIFLHKLLHLFTSLLLNTITTPLLLNTIALRWFNFYSALILLRLPNKGSVHMLFVLKISKHKGFVWYLLK